MLFVSKCHQPRLRPQRNQQSDHPHNLFGGVYGPRMKVGMVAEGNRTLSNLTQIALPKQTRLRFGIGLGVVGIIGMIVSDQLEDKFPAAQPGQALA